jgi:hypothetical protein
MLIETFEREITDKIIRDLKTIDEKNIFWIEFNTFLDKIKFYIEIKTYKI